MRTVHRLAFSARATAEGWMRRCGQESEWWWHGARTLFAATGDCHAMRGKCQCLAPRLETSSRLAAPPVSWLRLETGWLARNGGF
eukprot:6804655-Prymnesium_polylepis.2